MALSSMIQCKHHTYFLFVENGEETDPLAAELEPAEVGSVSKDDLVERIRSGDLTDGISPWLWREDRGDPYGEGDSEGNDARPFLSISVSFFRNKAICSSIYARVFGFLISVGRYASGKGTWGARWNP